jgi:hypothetical protein
MRSTLPPLGVFVRYFGFPSLLIYSIHLYANTAFSLTFIIA